MTKSTKTTVTGFQLAGMKAALTKALGSRKGLRGKARAEHQALIDHLQSRIDNAKVDPKSAALQSAAAVRAHRTRNVVALKRIKSRTKRAELQEKISGFELRLPEFGAPKPERKRAARKSTRTARRSRRIASRDEQPSAEMTAAPVEVAAEVAA